MYLAYLSILQGVLKIHQIIKTKGYLQFGWKGNIFHLCTNVWKEVVEIQLSPFTYNRQVATTSNFVDQQKDLKKMPWSF